MRVLSMIVGLAIGMALAKDDWSGDTGAAWAKIIISAVVAVALTEMLWPEQSKPPPSPPATP